MSLINQALRKVQSERTANRSTIQNSTPGASYTYRRNPNNKTGLLIALGVCITLLIFLVAGLILVLLFKNPEPAFAEKNAQQTDRNMTVDSLADAVKNNVDARTEELTHPKKSIGQADTATKPPVPVAEPKQEIIEWLSQSTVFGIRISKNSNKVILNDKAFTTGETVNFDFDLKLLEVTEDKLLFVDPDGAEYIKGL